MRTCQPARHCTRMTRRKNLKVGQNSGNNRAAGQGEGRENASIMQSTCPVRDFPFSPDFYETAETAETAAV